MEREKKGESRLRPFHDQVDTVGSRKEGTKLETMSANTDGIICESYDVCQPSIDDDTGIIFVYRLYY